MRTDGVQSMEHGCPMTAPSVAGAGPQTVPANFNWKPTDFCKHGHAFTEANTIRDGNKRQCRECKRLAARRYRFKLKLRGPVVMGANYIPNRGPARTKLPLVRKLFEIVDEKRLTDIDLEDIVGYERRSYCKWRGGVSIPTAAALIDCFNALGYDLVPVKRDKQ